MKNFRTIIQAEQSNNKISYHTPIMFLGSCFTENVGNKMEELKFPTLVNPFGVLYNPVSVRSALEILLDQKKFTESDLNYFNEQWFSFYHDTEYSSVDKQKCLDTINSSTENASNQLRNASYLIITFGTAWVYKYLKSNEVVSNCHKIPANEFKRFRLEPEAIFIEWSNLINRLNQLNKNLKIIFTVSPVRHWKDGAIENQLSKSTLILAIHQLKNKFQNVEYFPAYEIMMDDLRDYRFYADDMLHPSNVAIDYIWDFFGETYFEKETKEIIQQIGKVIRAKKHRSMNSETEAYKKFIQDQIQFITEIDKKYDFLDLSQELNFFKLKQ